MTNESQQSKTAMIVLKDISLRYGDEIVLEDFNLTVNQNDMVAVVGPSGTGKSSLLRVIAGLLLPDNGEIFLGSEKIGLAFQYGALFTSLTAGENIQMVLERTTDLGDDEVDRRVHETLAMVGLEDIMDKTPDELSGGMQKRIGIARALAIHPDIMLYDEPSAGLDPIIANKLETDLREINQTLQMATIVVTHELPTIHAMADRVVMLYQGHTVYSGSKQDFFTTQEPYARQFRTRSNTGPITV